jgi:hypothetical protein
MDRPMMLGRGSAMVWGCVAWIAFALAAPAASFMKDDAVRCLRSGVNGRAAASSTAAVTARPNEGETGVVLEGPLRHRGTDWWRIDWGGRRVGWTAEHEPGRPSIRYLDLVAFVKPAAAEAGVPAPVPATPAAPAAAAASAAVASTPPPVVVAAAERTELRNLRSDVGAIIQILATLDARIDTRIEARGAAAAGGASAGSWRWGGWALWLGGIAVAIALVAAGFYLRQAPASSGSMALLESRLAALERRLASQAGPAVRHTTLPPPGSVPRVATAHESNPTPPPTPSPAASPASSAPSP